MYLPFSVLTSASSVSSVTSVFDVKTPFSNDFSAKVTSVLTSETSALQ